MSYTSSDAAYDSWSSTHPEVARAATARIEREEAEQVLPLYEAMKVKVAELHALDESTDVNSEAYKVIARSLDSMDNAVAVLQQYLEDKGAEL